MILPEIDSFYSELAERIKSRRILKKISQDDIAKHLSLSRLSVLNIEKGKHRPSIYQLLLIAQYLNIDFQDLLPIKTLKEFKENTTKKRLRKIVSDQTSQIDDSTQAVINSIYQKP